MNLTSIGDLLVEFVTTEKPTINEYTNSINHSFLKNLQAAFLDDEPNEEDDEDFFDEDEEDDEEFYDEDEEEDY